MEDEENLLTTSRTSSRKVRYGTVCMRIWMCVGLLCASVTFFVYTTYTVDDFEGFQFSTSNEEFIDTRWTWTCEKSRCQKRRFESGEQVPLETCNMLCGDPQIWPMPGKINANTGQSSSFFLQQLHLNVQAENPAKSMLAEAFDIFHANVQRLAANKSKPWYQRSEIDHFNINLALEDSSVAQLKLDTDESYALAIKLEGRDIQVNVTAATFFGARHGLETLSQLIWWDKFKDGGMLKILHDVDIHDKPSFPYRGLMLDTARNYFPVDLLGKIIEGMSANKLNAFHWHITDSQSFPFYAPSSKFLAEDGAYRADEIYTPEDIRRVINFARVRGIRVIIEIDAPAHTLSGWESGAAAANMSELIVKAPNGMNGQLNPDNPSVLGVLTAIYSDVLRLMDNDELFHMGGDEVDLNLWKDLKRAKNYPDLTELWGDYLRDISRALKEANNGVSPRNTIIWSSKLTESPKLKKYLDVSSTIIQYWYGNSRQFMMDRYRVILSSVNHWYLDCGFGAWREDASPNCDPYRTWQTFYKATPWVGFDLGLVVGGEVCMWTEQVGEDSLETRIWPRAAAYAERIWSNPSETRWVPPAVYTRLDSQRTRMVNRGIKSAVFWPQWCTQNPGKC